MNQRTSEKRTRGYWLALAATFATFAGMHANAAAASELSVDDFKFDGPLGCQGATIQQVGVNHFKVSLGHAPKQPTWCNMLYFQIVRNAKGNTLRLDVEFKGGDAYRFKLGTKDRTSSSASAMCFARVPALGPRRKTAWKPAPY